MPPAPMPLFRGRRPLKRWRYVSVFGETLMACAASIQVGPARQTFWAVLDRSSGELRERTRLIPRRGRVVLEPGRLLICDGGLTLELSLEEEDGIQAKCPHGDEYVWTRKQAGVRAHGAITVGAQPAVEIECQAVIDDTAGYHARITEWRWAAGIGRAHDGTALAFNLVEGVNDPPEGSERAVWVDGVAREVAPVSFAGDLRTISCADGSQLSFRAEAQRRRSENLLLVRSDYLAPFGTFSGTLPGGIELAEGLGVVERHRAHW